MPCDYKQYHPKWKLIRRLIMKRAGCRCEGCGVLNYAVGQRFDDGFQYACGNGYLDFFEYTNRFADARAVLETEVEYWQEVSKADGYPKPIMIVLTIAHLDHDITNNRFDNLKALCQKCHLSYDHAYHMKNAKATRDKRRGVQRLF